MWRPYNNNPIARRASDCSARAVALALDTDWETAYAEIASSGFMMCDVPSSNAVWGAVLRKHGFKRHAIPNTCPDCYTAADFVLEHPNGIYVLGFGNHVATAVDGVVFDSWNSTGEIPQYYWSKEDEQ